MASVGAYEAKTHLPRLLERVEAGETVTITKHGREVARLVPAGQRLGDPREIATALRVARRGVSRGRRSIRDMIGDGRR